MQWCFKCSQDTLSDQTGIRDSPNPFSHQTHTHTHFECLCCTFETDAFVYCLDTCKTSILYLISLQLDINQYCSIAKRLLAVYSVNFAYESLTQEETWLVCVNGFKHSKFTCNSKCWKITWKTESSLRCSRS